MSRTIEERAAAAIDNALPGMQLDALAQAGLLVTDAKALRSFLDACGDASKCSGCDASIWWFRSRKGTNWPIDERGNLHFGSCPKADEFRRDRRA